MSIKLQSWKMQNQKNQELGVRKNENWKMGKLGIGKISQLGKNYKYGKLVNQEKMPIGINFK